MDGIRLFCDDGYQEVMELISEVREAGAEIGKRVFTTVELRQPHRKLIVGPIPEQKLKIQMG